MTLGTVIAPGDVLAAEEAWEEEEFPTGGLLPIEEYTVPEDEAEYFEETVEYSLQRSAGYYGSEWEKYGNYYFYNQMSEAERDYWDSLQALCVQYMEENTEAIKVSDTKCHTKLVKSSYGLTKDEMKRVAWIFWYNNPQYYFLSNSLWSNSSAVGFGIYPAFGDSADRAAATERVKSQVDTWQAQIDACSTDAEKVKLIHDLIIQKVEYNKAIYEDDFDENTQYTQSAYSVFCTDLTVCAGYSQAFGMMCNGSGIDAIMVSSPGHQWNKVRIDDSWYNMDLTWDDQKGTVYYSYFERSDAVFDTSSSHHEHSWWEKYLPECTLDSGASKYSPGTLPKISDVAEFPVIKEETDTGVTITCPTENAKIYYTLDGSVPEVSGTKSLYYNDTFTINEGDVVNAIAVSNGYWDSDVSSNAAGTSDTYTIIFDGNGAQSGNMVEQTVAAGVPGTLRRNGFQKENSSFAGWNTNPDGTGVFYENGANVKDLKGDITLYAQWNETYQVTYDGNGADGGNVDVQAFAAGGAAYTAKNKFTRESWRFTGWNTNPDGSGNFYKEGAALTEGAGDITLYAQWEKVNTISFDGNGASAGSMDGQEVIDGTAVLAANMFTRDGYRFTGWNTSADGTGTAYADEAQITGLSEDTTLYAQWEAIAYVISYELNGGENGQNPAAYTCTDSITLQEPKRTGYTFEGWYTDAGFNSPAAGIAAGSTGDRVFYAKWEPIRYRITFSGNGGSGAMREMTDLCYDKEYYLPANTYIKTEYVFTGWNTAADGSGTAFSDGAAVKNLTASADGNVTLYARWEVKGYTITYQLNGGKNNSGNPASYTSFTDTITLKEPTRTGYIFKGWYTDSNYKNQAAQIKKGSTGDKTFYAKWEAKKYTIVFKGNGSTKGKMSSLTARKYGKSYQLTANKFKKTGYSFAGWNTKKDGSGTSFKNKATVKNLTTKSGGKVVLYAQWKKTKYTITYKLKGGKNAAKNPGYYYYTTKTITLKKPTRKGYQFVGWYSDSKYKKKVTKIKKGSTGNITLYAKWKKK